MEQIVKNEISRILNIEINEIKDLKRFAKGMSNYTYYFVANNEKYVIRLIGEGADKYINYYNELNSILIIQEKELTSELIYFDPVTGTKLARYIEGEILDFNKLNNMEHLIERLKKFHSIKSDVLLNYDLINRLKDYESFNDHLELDVNYYNIKKWWIDLYNEEYKNETLVFCHNDLQDANIIDSKEKIYFIDFEYSAMNDVYYDFASFEDNAYLVYENYFNEQINNKAKNHIDFYRVYQSLQWYLVATYKESIGFSEKTNYNFKDLMDYFITTANKLYEDIVGRGI